MTEKFVPLQYLENSDKQLLRNTQKNIKRAQTNAELHYYESVFNNLMKKAVKIITIKKTTSRSLE